MSTRSPHSRWPIRWLWSLALGVVLSACDGTGPGSVTPAPANPPPPSPPAPTVARVDIVQTGLLFTERDQTRQLTARVTTADGAVLDVPVTWSSNDEGDIAVGSNGVATARTNSGSSLIVASAGNIRSTPMLAVISSVGPGTILVDDTQIVRGPVESTPTAVPDLDNTYSVVVSGIAAPAIGTLMAGTGSQPVAGRVVATRDVAGGVEITLKLAPIPELFPGLDIDQDFDLSQAEFTVPETITAAYDVSRTGTKFRFVPKTRNNLQTADVATPAGTFAFDQGCEGEVNGAGLGPGAAPPFVFETLPSFDLDLSPRLQIRRTPGGEIKRFAVSVDSTMRLEAAVAATVAFEGKVECKAELVVYRVPIGGAVSLVIGGLVPVGIGFELAGKVTVAQVKAGYSSVTRAKAVTGLACDAECGFLGEITDFTSTNTPTVDVPAIEDFRVEPDFTGFLYAEGDVGNPFLNSLRFEAFEFKAGPKLEIKAAPPATQIAAADFSSNYKVVLKAFAGFGDDIEKVLNILGVVAVGDEVLEISTDIAESPTGLMRADKAEFVAGDVVNFAVTLDADRTAFLGLYNLSEIVLMRNAGGLREVARVIAIEGQREFNIRWPAPSAGRSTELHAFVVTRLLPFDVLSIELANAPPPTGAVRLLRARVDSVPNATRCPRGQNCEPAAFDLQIRDSQGLPLQDRYAVDPGPVTGINTSADSASSLDVPGGSAGGFSSLAVNCSGSARITRVSGVDFATADSATVVAFEVPAGATVPYVVNLEPALASVDFAGANAFFAIIADPDGSLFPATSAEAFYNERVLNFFRSPNDRRRAGAPFLFGARQGVTAYDAFPEQGGRSGVLPPGRYSVAVYCFSGGGTGSGSASNRFAAGITLGN